MALAVPEQAEIPVAPLNPLIPENAGGWVGMKKVVEWDWLNRPWDE